VLVRLTGSSCCSWGSRGPRGEELPPVSFIDGIDGFVVLDLIRGPDAFDLVIQDEALASEDHAEDAVSNSEIEIFYHKDSKLVLRESELLQGIVFGDGVIFAIPAHPS